MELLNQISEAVIKGDADKAREATQSAIDQGLGVATILNEGLIAGMNFIGVRFKNNEVYVPEVLIAARAMHAGMGVLKPLIAESGLTEKAVVVVGTVKGDLHDIGKNLVIMMLEGAGYKVVDLGVDVPVEKFVSSVEEYKPDFICLSALLTTTMAQMKLVIEQLEPYRKRVKILVGGAPVSQKFADDICADAYAPDAASAVDLVNGMLAS